VFSIDSTSTPGTYYVILACTGVLVRDTSLTLTYIGAASGTNAVLLSSGVDSYSRDTVVISGIKFIGSGSGATGWAMGYNQNSGNNSQFLIEHCEFVNLVFGVFSGGDSVDGTVKNCKFYQTITGHTSFTQGVFMKTPIGFFGDKGTLQVNDISMSGDRYDRANGLATAGIYCPAGNNLYITNLDAYGVGEVVQYYPWGGGTEERTFRWQGGTLINTGIAVLAYGTAKNTMTISGLTVRRDLSFRPGIFTTQFSNAEFLADFSNVSAMSFSVVDGVKAVVSGCVFDSVSYRLISAAGDSTTSILVDGNVFRNCSAGFDIRNARIIYSNNYYDTLAGRPDYAYGAKIIFRGNTVRKSSEILFYTPNPTVDISGATNATPIVIKTSVYAPFRDTVLIYGVGGNTAANGYWGANYLTDTTFSLIGSVGNGAYTSGGKVREAVLNTMEVTGNTFEGDLLIGGGGSVTDTVAKFIVRNNVVHGTLSAQLSAITEYAIVDNTRTSQFDVGSLRKAVFISGVKTASKFDAWAIGTPSALATETKTDSVIIHGSDSTAFGYRWIE
jgi:hypothetical protein